MAWLIGNGLFIGAGIVANLAFEVIGLDLYVVALLAALALVVYYSCAYSVGLVVTILIKLARG